MEGYSSLVISVVKKIQGGTKSSHATKHWRLAKVTENIADLVIGMNRIVLQAIKRKANRLADYLVNCGIDNKDEVWDNCWQQVDCPVLKVKCLQLAKQDSSSTNQD